MPRDHQGLSVIPSSGSLEDGEIAEGHISSVSSGSLLQQQLSNDQPGLRSSGQDKAPSPTPAFSSVESDTSPAPSVKPMTKEDLDRAKSLVLDLLGWGVTPEYLVECGLSPAVIYTVFSDLRLRLPNNLDALSPPPSQRGAP